MVKISKKLASCYINCLPRAARSAMIRELVAMVKAGNLTRVEALEAMTSKVRDMEDTVNLQYVE